MEDLPEANFHKFQNPQFTNEGRSDVRNVSYSIT
jgi:hypothetical protein